MSTASFDIRAASRLLRELHECQRAIAERESRRRVDALHRVEEAIRRLGEIGTSAGILDRAAQDLGAATGFHRILISELAGRLLIPRRLWSRDHGAVEVPHTKLGELAITLAYPLIEAELALRPRSEALVVDASGPRSPGPLQALLGWDVYVVCAIALQGGTIGFLHAEPPPGQAVDSALASHLVCSYADGLARAFERTALREMLARHRHELRTAVLWIGNELVELDDLEPSPLRGEHSEPPEKPGLDALTSREAQVLGLLGRGRTNASIARSLMISESTVKFHVKNILLKLGAKSRADAVARHMRGAI
jgi:DNA-binding CsgD family transcriptional regulator